jgi:hypothetical protein
VSSGDVGEPAHFADLYPERLFRVPAECQACFEQYVGPRLPGKFTFGLLLTTPAQRFLWSGFLIRSEEHHDRLTFGHGGVDDVLNLRVSTFCLGEGYEV